MRLFLFLPFFMLSGCTSTGAFSPTGLLNKLTSNGAPITQKKRSYGESYSLRDQVVFDFGKSKLKKEVEPFLNDLYEKINATEDYIYIVGYTDSIGGFERNITLSERRAENVLDYLVKKGLKESRFSGLGFGKLYPIADNSSEVGQQKNRRVEIHVVNPESREKYASSLDRKKNQLKIELADRKLKYETAKEKIGKSVEWVSTLKQYTDDCAGLFGFNLCMWVTYKMQFTGKVRTFDQDRGEYLVDVFTGKLKTPRSVSVKYLQYQSVAEQQVNEFVGSPAYVPFEEI
ncbi:MAG: outer membrane protein OmpA-like peptidoglycan-associated protein [Arenicella sp.]|jgi:outer membrane protein OmpA-like peptidoglycan-associated protein